MKRSRSFLADFTFHNVGQGLFYTGKINGFNFVYDCGSENKRHLNFVVDNFARNTPTVDLLILSHLHQDHTAGLDALFNSKTRIGTVVLPYLPPRERLMVALSNINVSSWLFDFWANPVAFLINRGVGRVVLIESGGGERPPEYFPSEEELENEDKPPLDLSRMRPNHELRKRIISEEQLEDKVREDNFLVMDHYGYLKAKAIWFLRFFNSVPQDSNLDLFEKCINEHNIISDNDIINAISNKSYHKKLKKCYEKLQGDFNNTSLVVYHAPLMQERYSIIHPLCYEPSNQLHFRFPNKFSINLRNIFGHFLTGDIDLNKTLPQLEVHFGNYLSKVALALVPHHGSKDNWDKTILTKLAHTPSWVTSAGISNKYGHPSPVILQDISHKGRDLYCNNESIEISIKCLLHY